MHHTAKLKIDNASNLTGDEDIDGKETSLKQLGIFKSKSGNNVSDEKEKVRKEKKKLREDEKLEKRRLKGNES